MRIVQRVCVNGYVKQIICMNAADQRIIKWSADAFSGQCKNCLSSQILKLVRTNKNYPCFSLTTPQ